MAEKIACPRFALGGATMNNQKPGDATLKRELLGHVWVDSGRLLVTDPMYLAQLADEEDQLLNALPTRAELIGDGMAVAFQTGLRTARYPVYVTRYENGCVARVEIEFDARLEPAP
jgi:hypothetical protein